MCLPAAPLAIVALAATAATAVVGAVGQIQAGKAAVRQGEYENAIAGANAKLAAGQAKDAQDRGKEEAKRLAKQQAILKGKQIATQAASGVDVNFGSPVDVQVDTSVTGAEDLGTVYKNTEREVRSYDISASNYKSQGKAALMKAKAAKTASMYGAAGSILSGVTQMAGIAQKFGKSG